MFPVKCFGGWGKGEPGEARGEGGQHGQGGDGQGRTGRRGLARVGGEAWAGKDQMGWGARAKKDRARGSLTNALCTRFTLVITNLKFQQKPKKIIF